MPTIRSTANRVAQDGRIGKRDLRDIIAQGVDGRGITKNEASQLQKVREDFDPKFTSAAKKAFDNFLAKMNDGFVAEKNLFLPGVDIVQAEALFADDARLGVLFPGSQARPTDKMRKLKNLGEAAAPLGEARDVSKAQMDEMIALVAEGGITNRELKWLADFERRGLYHSDDLPADVDADRSVFRISEQAQASLDDFAKEHRLPIGGFAISLMHDISEAMHSRRGPTDASGVDDLTRRQIWNLPGAGGMMDPGMVFDESYYYDVENRVFYVSQEPLLSDGGDHVTGPFVLREDAAQRR